MDQKCEGDAQHDDAADNEDVVEFVCDDGAQNFAAEHEFQRQRHGFSQIQTNVDIAASEVADEVADGTEANDDDAHNLQQVDDYRDDGDKTGFDEGCDRHERNPP